MKMPNFRLYETQAKASVFLGIVAWICLAGLVVVTFKGFDAKDKIIPYNAEQGISRFRPYMIMAGTALTLLVGAVAGILGFSSLGQKRNEKQGASWLGLLIGAAALSIAPVVFFAWKQLSEAIITRGG